jgi:hypothetical protein
MKVTEELWQKVNQKYKECNTTDSIMAWFDVDLERNIDERMKSLDPQRTKNLNVACVNWHFSSGERIQLLIDRGNLLKTG